MARKSVVIAHMDEGGSSSRVPIRTTGTYAFYVLAAVTWGFGWGIYYGPNDPSSVYAREFLLFFMNTLTSIILILIRKMRMSLSDPSEFPGEAIIGVLTHLKGLPLYTSSFLFYLDYGTYSWELYAILPWAMLLTGYHLVCAYIVYFERRAFLRKADISRILSD